MATEINEGVMGGVMAMPAINRIIQLAGLEHTGTVEAIPVTEEQINEDTTGTMMDTVVRSAENLAQFKGNVEAAKLYAAGSILSSVGKMMQSTELQSAEAMSKKKEIDAIAAFGADLIKTAQMLGAKTK